jgi:signal transduction histidine kinase
VKPQAGEDAGLRLDECNRELDELRLRVRQLEDQGTRFLAAAAHALVNPLTIAHCYLEIVVSELDDGLSDEQRSFISTALDATRRIRALVDELIELASLETGAAGIRAVPLSAATVVEGAVRELRPAADDRGVRVICELPRKLPMVEADEHRLRDALRRLLEYGVRVSPAGDTVTAHVSAEPGSIVIRVDDCGPGVAEEHQAQIFDPFFQLADGPDRRRQGIGLGLAIAKRQIEACGGTIEISRRSGPGSRFTIRLRCA